MTSETFILDTNSFINPHRTYFNVGYAHHFWSQLHNILLEPNIKILNVVYDEIIKSEDDLSKWFKDFHEFKQETIKNEEITANYRKVMNYLNNCEFYQDTAIRIWSQLDHADSWLIAAAMYYNATIVTFETKSKHLDIHFPSNQIKIPDVAEHFGVKYINMYHFIRQMNFEL